MPEKPEQCSLWGWRLSQAMGPRNTRKMVERDIISPSCLPEETAEDIDAKIAALERQIEQLRRKTAAE